jgi:hypothetical protein
MANDADPVQIVGSRTTEDGLLVKFNDGTIYLFDTSFLVENRLKHGDRIHNPSLWLTENWKRGRSSSVL